MSFDQFASEAKLIWRDMNSIWRIDDGAFDMLEIHSDAQEWLANIL